jgi:colanic acid biosynthesis glycosyl transferase WcaI
VRKPDVIHVYQGPATLAFPAMVLRVCFGVPYVLDIQDIWPESVLSSGMLRFPAAALLLNRWCGLAYRLAAKIVVLSPGYKSALMARGVPASKIEVVYNWCEETRMLHPKSSGGDADPFGLSGRFNVVYAGNLGRIQALDAVVQAAGLLRKRCPDVQFVFVGDGVDTERLKCKVADERIANIKFIPRQPIDKVGAILSRADALLIHLRDDPLCRIGIPQKTQAYLAAGRPIIMAVRGDATNLVQQANAGIVCEPENAASIAEAVESLFLLPFDKRRAMARNGRDFYDKHLSFPVGLNRMITIFSGVVQ